MSLVRHDNNTNETKEKNDLVMIETGKTCQVRRTEA